MTAAPQHRSVSLERPPADARAAAGPRETNGPLATGILIYLGLSLQLLQVGIIPLLPAIGEDIGTSPATTSWLVTGGLLSGAVLLAVFSRIADLIGKKPVILIALGLVLAGSLVGCFSDGFAGLLTARLLMGAILPMLALPEAIASDTMSPQRAQFAIGAIHSGTGTGIAAGLLLGTLTATESGSWRIYFVVGVIASAIGLVVTVTGIRDSEVRAPGRLDIVGAFLLAAGLVGVLLAITEGPTWHWSSPGVLTSGLLGLAAFVVWWFVERRVAHPLISMRHLLAPAIRLPYAITFLAAMGIYSALSAVTRLAQTPAETGAGYGWSADQTAWYVLPQFVGPLAGLLVIRAFVPRGRRVAGLAVGVLMLIVSFAISGPLLTHASGTLIGLFVDAAGLTVVLAVTQMVILRNVPAAESGIAVGLSVVIYAVGNSVGNAIAASLFAAYTVGADVPSLTGYRLSFLISGLAVVAALGLCALLSRRRGDSEAPVSSR